MTDLLEQGAAWLDAQRHEHMTRSVVYERGAESIDIAATVGRTEFEQTDEYGVVQRLESRDFLIRTAELVLGGQRVLPQAGDQIREISGNQMHRYEVMGPGGAPPWRYSDAYRLTLRIHTKHIGTEAV